MKYSQLVEVYEKLEASSKRLDKTFYVSELLKESSNDDLDMLMLLLQGRVYPSYDERKIGVAARIVLKALNVATGITVDKIELDWKKTGDLGKTAENLISKKKQATLFSQELSVKKVFSNLQSLSELEGLGTVDKKIQLIAELLTSSKPNEAKYIVRTLLEDLRVGVSEGTLRDSIVWAYFPRFKDIMDKKHLNGNVVKVTEVDTNMLNGNDVVEIDAKTKGEREKLAREAYNYLSNAVQEALDMSNDYGLVAKAAKGYGLKGLQSIKLDVETPLKVMLYQKADSFEDAFERVGKPAAFEFKFDGFRLQIHKGKHIKLYTRRLEDVTVQFPDVVDAIRRYIDSDGFILDAEVVGLDKTGKNLPFQKISQRIKRKHNIQEMVEKIPVRVNLFDAIEVNGISLLKKPFKERRDFLERITKKNKIVVLADQLVTDNIKEAKKFYEKALKLGNEGVMAKNLDAPYKPGSRVGYGVKIKPTMETLDLVIVGAEWGEGKRSTWLSSFVVACLDEDSGEFLEVGRVSTGLKEKAEEGLSFEEMTGLLKDLVVAEKGKMVEVKPKIVIQVDYEEIQKSPTYGSGFGLRFPRIVGLRIDKPVGEISTLQMVEELFYQQRK